MPVGFSLNAQERDGQDGYRMTPVCGLRCYVVRLNTYGQLGELFRPLVRVRGLAAGGLGACLDSSADVGSDSGLCRECFRGRAGCGA
jgi:hypothetical protein